MSHVKKQPHKSSLTSLNVTERPKVSFGPFIEGHKSVPGKQKQKENAKQSRHVARGYFTPNPGKSWMSAPTDNSENHLFTEAGT